jgi:hypothetical protein
LANLSNGKVITPRITENSGKFCPNHTAGLTASAATLMAKIRLRP